MRVLISGAGIAGPSLAWWLQRYGFACTVVERSPTLRTEGQNVDIRGAAREVVRRMGLDDEVAARSTGEQGTRFIDGAGHSVAEFPVTHSDTEGATAEREILRGQLASLLYEQTRGAADYRFGHRIAEVRDGEREVTVSFDQGGSESFDLVVLAEGVNSRSRDSIVNTAITERSLGLTIAYYSVERSAADDDWWRWYNALGGRTISLRPDNLGRIRVSLSFLSDSRVDSDPDQGSPKDELTERFRDAGGPAGRVLAGLADADDLYVERLRQIRADRWSNGRTVLLGDAAWCATPVSGMGTSLAVVGAYVLAGELAAHVHHQDGLAAYERVMRPYVDQAQDLPPGTPRLAHPRSRPGLAAFRTALRLAGSPAFAPVRRRMFAPPADRLQLPDFRHLETTRSS